MATPYKPTREERIEDLKPHVLPAVGGLIVLAVGGWVVWHQYIRMPPAPKRTVVAAASAPMRTEVARLAGEADELEKRAQDLELAAAEPAERDAALTAAIRKRRELERLSPEAGAEQNARRQRLETARAGLRAQVATTRSVALEAEAQNLLGAGQRVGAIDRLREALRLQQEADANAPPDLARNLPREAQLAATMTDLEAQPWHEAVVAARKQGAAAMASGQDAAAALKALQEARAAQAEINRKYPTSRYADLAAVTALDATLAAIGGDDLANAIAAHVQEANDAVAAGKLDEAAKAYEAAAAAQRELKAKYPLSRFVAMAELDAFTVRRETMLSQPAITKVAALDREAAALRWHRQNAAAAQKLAAATELLDATMVEFPRSRALDPLLRRRIDFLTLRRDEVEALQAEVWARLVALWGGAGTLMLRNEVTQDLYRRVMNMNPSRNIGPMLPVDSVSWEDTQEFCRRLSWVMGGIVRLPTEAEFRGTLADAGPSGWFVENAGNHSHEPGTQEASADGFYDLRGNLAEWLQAVTADGESAPLGGGSFLDPGGDRPMATFPLADRKQRERQIGFRVVVEPQPDPNAVEK